MFVEITDRAKILELYEAGLLWDSGLQADGWDGPFPSDWDCMPTSIMDVIGGRHWKFYILLEE